MTAEYGVGAQNKRDDDIPLGRSIQRKEQAVNQYADQHTAYRTGVDPYSYSVFFQTEPLPESSAGDGADDLGGVEKLSVEK